MIQLRTLSLALLLVASLLLDAPKARATETENNLLSILPARAPIVVDGRANEWDLSAGILVCPNVEQSLPSSSFWLSAQYDARNLYLLARWNDPTPLNNPGTIAGDMGFAGDSLQLRFITGANTPQELVSHWTLWRGSDGRDEMNVAYGRDFLGGNIKEIRRDARGQGAAQAFQVNPDGRGYVQEVAIPWAFLFKDGHAPASGDSFRMTVQGNFSGGPYGRIEVTDLFAAGVPRPRGFAYTAYSAWGEARLERVPVAPRPVRLADGRTFPVAVRAGVPVVDWTNLDKTEELRGFVPIRFVLPRDGFVSLNIENQSGFVARQLLMAQPFRRGAHTVLWDGLTSPRDKLPGEVVPPGTYRWRAIYHTGIGLKLRGFASHGGQVPWDDGPHTNWGGDHGVPSALASDGTRVFLGWSASEAGRALVCADSDGRVQWKHTRGAFGGASYLALDGNSVYVVDGARDVFRLNKQTGTYVPFPGSSESSVSITQLLGSESGPDTITGMDARAGQLFLSVSRPLRREDVSDWPAMLRLLQRQSTPITRRAFNALDPYSRERLARFLETGADKNLAAREFIFDDLRDIAARALALSPRPQVEAAFPNLVARGRLPFVAVVDLGSGRVIQRVPVVEPGPLKARADGSLLVLSAQSQLLEVRRNTQGVSVRPLISGLKRAEALCLDAGGGIYIGEREPDNQVEVFSPRGKLLRTVGKRGGRPLLGVWQREGLRFVSALCVDGRGQLWIGEADRHPKRFSVWNAKGQIEREFFGPTHYGASGGAIAPFDPNVMVGEGCEWKLDPTTGRATCVGVFAREIHNFARFARASGRTYLVVHRNPGGILEQGIAVYERLGAGRYALRSSIMSGEQTPFTTFWSDENGDGQIQPNEVQRTPPLSLGGYYDWSLGVNTDLTIYAQRLEQQPDGAMRSLSSGMRGLQMRVSRFTPCGAPMWDIKSARPLLDADSATPSLDNSLLLTNRVEEGLQDSFRAYDLQTGRLRWEYPNQYSGVHGSHSAPPAQNGMIRGAFGFVGSAHLPAPVGDLWAINTNVGEWHLLTQDGFYLSRLFQGDPLKIRWPKTAAPGVSLDEAPPGLGGEDFGGSLTQGDDGRIYLQAGKVALWNVEVVGLPSVRALGSGNFALSPNEVARARNLRAQYQQEAADPKRLRVVHRTPTFSGNLDADFSGADIASYQKQDNARLRTALSYDERNLYVGWDVQDATPFQNGASEAAEMYVRGDTVDLQLGTNPTLPIDRDKAGLGDLRVSIGNLQGTPTTVLYRRVSTTKKPHSFSSGVVRDYRMDYVDILPGARIEVKRRDGGYTLEAALPFASLGFRPASGQSLRGDFGATHGDAQNERTRLRTYWSNLNTNLVDDQVFELQMTPRNWGELFFEP